MLKVYTASYYETYGYGAYDDIECIVIANTESEALGFLITDHPETEAEKWGIVEVDMSFARAELIHKHYQ